MLPSLRFRSVLLFAVLVSLVPSVVADPPVVDSLGDPLPTGAVMRLGSQRFRHQHYVGALAVSPDGLYLASGGHDYHAYLWNAKTGKRLYAFKDSYYVYAVAFTPDGRYFAHTYTRKNYYAGSIIIRDVKTLKEIRRIPVSQHPIHSIKFSPDGKYLAAAGKDTAVRLFDANSGKEVRQFEGHTKSIRAVNFSHNSKMLVSAGDDSSVRIWDVNSAKVLHRIDHDKRTGAISSVTFSPDGKKLAFGVSSAVHVWDLQTKQLKTKLERAWRPVAFSPDGKQFVTGGNSYAFHSWRAKTSEMLHTFVGHGSYLYHLAYSPDGKRIYSASADGTIRVWNPKTGEEIVPYSGHQYEVRAVAVSPDGTRIATSGGDNRVCVWGTA